MSIPYLLEIYDACKCLQLPYVGICHDSIQKAVLAMRYDVSSSILTYIPFLWIIPDVHSDTVQSGDEV